MKPDKYEAAHKKYLKNQKELAEVKKKLKDLPLIPFDKPVHKGWIVTVDLRDDAKNRQDAHILKKVLDLSYRYDYIDKVAHVKMIRAGKKGYSYRYKGKHTYHSFVPVRRNITEKEFQEMDEQTKRWFTLDTLHDHYRLYGRKWYYENIPNHFIVLKCRPRIFTHYKAKGGPLEKRETELEKEIHEYWRIYYNYKKSFPAGKNRSYVRDSIQKFLKGEAEDILEKKIPLEYEY